MNQNGIAFYFSVQYDITFFGKNINTNSKKSKMK